MDTKIRILIVDFDAILRETLILLLDCAPHFEIVADVTGGLAALRSARHHAPDVVLMGSSLPHADIEAVIAQIKKSTSAKVIVLSSQENDFARRRAYEAGADSYCSREIGVNELLSMIERVSAKERPPEPTIRTERLAAPEETAGTRSRYRLTPRELEILKMILRGYKSKDIAEFLDVSIKTVGKHRANIMKKLGVRNVAELTNLAIRRGLVTRS
jgi:DNA-binding NarL/FixJ family response regulator